MGATMPPPATGYAAPPLARGGRAEHAAMRSDPHSHHYDPRADPNSRYYDPEQDPKSRWYTGGDGGGGVSHRASQPAYGSTFTGAAYGVPPRSGGNGLPPRSAPPPAPAEPHSPPPHVKRSGGRSSRRGNKSTGQIGTSLAAATSLVGGPTDPADVGSLYYVLGANASSSRVKQLQQMLQVRRNAEERQRQQQGAPIDNSVAQRLEL